MRTLALLLALLLAWPVHAAEITATRSGSGGAITVTRGQAGATSTKASVLAYLTALPTGASNRLMLGTMDDFASACNGDEVDEFVANGNGKYPAIMACDYTVEGTGTASSGTVSYTNPNTELTAFWNSDGLVMVTMHIQNPCLAGSITESNNDVRTNCSAANFTQLITSGSTIYNRWRGAGYLQDVRDGLQVLEDAGVVVLFRPLHEMNLAFWWGDQNAANFKTLWQQTYDYLVTDSGLSNLLWVYSALSGAGNEDAFYPGDAYVDMTALDAYKGTGSASGQWCHAGFPAAQGYDALLALGKPFFFSEVGDSNPTDPDGNINYLAMINCVEDNNMTNAFAMVSWKRKHAFGYVAGAVNNGLPAALTHAWVMTRDEVNIPEPAATGAVTFTR